MAKERESLYQSEVSRTYPNFNQALTAWLEYWQNSKPVNSGKIQLKTREASSSDAPRISTADIVAFLHKWYDKETESGKSDPAREAYKGAREVLGIRGQERQKYEEHFYTLTEAKAILTYVYEKWSRIKQVEQK